MPKKQISAGEIDKSPGTDYSWIKNVPPSDVGFKSSLDRSDASLIREVLKDLPSAAVGEKTRRKVLEARLRKLEKIQPAIEPDNKIKIELDEDFQTNSPAVVAVEIERITPSPFEPQQRRRARFKNEEIESLGNSIVTLGMFQPIVVRPKFPDFEIVFGERRFLASKAKNLKTIDCFIRDLSDAETLELQYEENHRRQETSPLDDAFLFKFLKEHEGYSEEQIADRLNTRKQNVVDKLKLNDLISEARAELESNALPLKHAVYIARFPAATQTEIVRAKYAYKYNDAAEKPVSFDEFKAEVEANILRRLANAPFNIGDPRLHIKQLVCVECPEQTAAQNYLFPDHPSADARCLNPGCFRLKTDTHLKLKREEIAEQKPNPNHTPVEEVAKSVPLVTEKSYAPAQTPFVKEKVITGVEILPEPECEFSESSLAVGGEQKGKEVYICRSESCAVHHPKPKTPAGEFSEDEAERLWADYNRRVLAVVRERILVAAVESFNDYSMFWQFDDLIQKLIVEFWFILPAETKQTVNHLLRGLKGVPDARSPYWEFRRFVKTLDKTNQSKILFLLVSAGESAHRFETDLVEDYLANLAKEYTRESYRSLDAEARFELAPEEFKPEANLYLQYIKNGHFDKEPPVFWIEEPEDEV